MRTPSIQAAAGLSACLIAVAACGTGATTSTSPAPTSSLVAPLPGQTETEWGLIWDDVPADFPIFAGAKPSDEAVVGPTSATLVVDGSDAATIAAWTADQLTQAGYEVGGGTALEDGSYPIDAIRDTECQVHVEAAPLGGLTSITILYGAGCPNP